MCLSFDVWEDITNVDVCKWLDRLTFDVVS